MSDADEFRRYAEEAAGWLKNCANPEERLVLQSLVRTWQKAAEFSEGPPPGPLTT
jgi:hypothetical protein